MYNCCAGEHPAVPADRRPAAGGAELHAEHPRPQAAHPGDHQQAHQQAPHQEEGTHVAMRSTRILSRHFREQCGF